MCHVPKPPGRDVSREIVQSASRCPYQHACARDVDFEVCPVHAAAGGQVLFVQSETKPGCRYCSSFGYRCLCLCPARKEIFAKCRA